MPRTGVWRAGSLLLAALLAGCGESEIAEPGTQDGGARDTTTISADAVARLRQGHYADVRGLAQAVSLPTAFARAEALHALAARSEEAGLKALLDEAAEIADPADRHLARQVLYLRYAELDAAAAARGAAAESPPESRELIKMLFGDWARRDPDGAFAALQEFSADTDLQRSAAEGLLEAHLWRDSDEAGAILARLPHSLSTPHMQGEAVAANAERDPAAAFEQALTLVDRAARQTALLRVAETWAATDPQSAFERVRGLTDARFRASVGLIVATGWAKRDPEALWAAADVEDDRRLRGHMQTAALSALAMEDTERAFELADELEANDRSSAYFLMVSRLAMEDPDRAADAVLVISDADARRRAAQSIVGTLVSRDIDAALEWAETVEGERGSLWRAALKQAARSDPLVALNRASALGDADERASALATVIRGAAATAPDLAAGYIGELPAGPLRDKASSALMNALAASDPRAAMEFVLARPPEERDSLLPDAARRFAENHPDIAEQYVGRLAGKDRTVWLTAQAKQKASDDPVVAAAWLDRYQGDGDFDRLATTLSENMAFKDPQAALDIAGRIGNDALRSVAMAGAAGALVSRAPEDAMAVYNRVPEEDRSPQLVERMVKSMMRTDSRRTEQWLESLSDPAMRDTGFLNMAARTSDLDRSLDYVRRISGERMRVRAAVALLMRNRRDPDSVDRILGDADLPPSVVTQLREEMRRRFPMGVTR